MSLFWRLVIGFSVAVLATFAAQRITGSGLQGQATMARVAVMNSPVATRQGELALHALAEGNQTASQEQLVPLEGSGVNAWLVTSDSVIGVTALPDHLQTLARKALSGDAKAKIGLGGRMRVVQDGRRSAVLVMTVASLRSPVGLLGRTLMIIGIPVLTCLLLARLFAAPVERIGATALAIANGDLDRRVGKVSGPKEVQRVATAFDAMADRVTDELRARSRLLADVSHEIRSPLSRIQMASALLCDGKGDANQNIERIQRDVARLDDLVESLRLAVPEQRPMQFTEAVDMLSLSTECVEAARLEAEPKGVKILFTGEPLVLKGDSRALHSLVENVIRNAVIHAPADTSIDVYLMAKSPLFSVQDHGAGVPQEELQKIFEPFYRHSEARERHTGGTGLGLSIVRNVAQAHGGQAWAQLRPDGGLIVSATFSAGLVQPLQTHSQTGNETC